MVNENAGKKYEPTPVYCRKAFRKIIRAQAEKKLGYHNVSAMVHAVFEESRKKESENV